MHSIIKNPRITEKVSALLEHNVYTFDVAKDANKSEIKKAVFAMYKVRPARVNIVTTKPKTRMLRGKTAMKKGTKSGGKKAVVYLKEGDKIEFV